MESNLQWFPMTASRQLRSVILMFFFLVGEPCNASQPNSSSEQPNLVATERLAEWMSVERDFVYDATLTFLSDDTLGLQLCRPFPSSNCPLLIVLQIYDGGFRTLARRDVSGGPASLFRTEDGGILVVSHVSRSSQLFSADLTPKHQFPYAPSHVSISGSILANISDTVTTGASVTGRVIALTGAVTLSGNQIRASK
jgi:hypothetical protein